VFHGVGVCVLRNNVAKQGRNECEFPGYIRRPYAHYEQSHLLFSRRLGCPCHCMDGHIWEHVFSFGRSGCLVLVLRTLKHFSQRDSALSRSLTARHKRRGYLAVLKVILNFCAQQGIVWNAHTLQDQTQIKHDVVRSDVCPNVS